MDYKDTLNLPETTFPMKANLAQKEPEILAFWQDIDLYSKLLSKNKTSQAFVLHDGPPYANGNIHIGHALNKILKDIIVKYKSMQGFYSPYVPGWDCHGLPIELQVDKNLGNAKDSIETIAKRRLCRQYAQKYIDIQRADFIRLGVLGQWSRPYLTMSYDYEAQIVREFFAFVKRKSVYKGKKPVHWCASCVTALAEAEVEYADKQSPSIFVRFKVTEDAQAKYFPNLTSKSIYIVIWTTTPWTLPANLALAVHPEITYALVESTDAVYIVANDSVDTLKQKGILAAMVIKQVLGKDLSGLQTLHPFIDRHSNVFTADFVEVGEGSGIVHIAPGHGEDDYEVGIAHGLDIYAPVDDRGRFTRHVPEFEGQFVFKANEGILELLRQKSALLDAQTITHSYPHCWRCKKPVIFRATAQWFISMSINDLRQKCLDEIQKVRWIPEWGKDRIYNMVKSRPDWCISRQRAWGVPIMLFTCEDCGELYYNEAFFEEIVQKVEVSGADVWFTDIQLPKGAKCAKCGSQRFYKEKDILDVWFDSGVSHSAVLAKNAELRWPADMYLEGSDQHRGWFQSSLLASVGTQDQAPYKIVLTHGFTVDGQGRKMSKSLGNVISPQEIIKNHGAELVRLWVSAEDYKEDIRLSKEILNRLTEAYRKIRNTCRYLLGAINDFDHSDYSNNLTEIDRWAMSRLQGLIAKVTDAYERFNFYEVYHLVYQFCIVDMSAFYLDILKDRLYTFKADSPLRRSAQWTMKQILFDMTRLIAPILSFTAEEVYRHMPGKDEQNCPSIFLTGFPQVNPKFLDKDLEAVWDRLIAIRNFANKALEIKRQEKFIGNALEASLHFYLPKEQYDLLISYKDFLPTLFIVSEVKLFDNSNIPEVAYRYPEIEAFAVVVNKAPGNKCQRCWNWSITVGSHPEHPSICSRCFEVISS